MAELAGRLKGHILPMTTTNNGVHDCIHSFLTGCFNRVQRFWVKSLFLTAPLISLQLPFQRRSTSSLKFQNQKDDNEESDVSCQFVFIRTSVSSQNHRMYPDVVCLLCFLITTLQHQGRNVAKFRIHTYKYLSFTFCLKHGNVYYRLFSFQWTDNLT